MKCLFPFKNRRAKSAPEPNRNKPVENSGSNSVPVTSPRTIPDMYKEKEGNLRVFSFSELKAATNNFDKLLKIGEGGFGSVYKGSVKNDHGEGNSIVVAIKKLSKNGFTETLTENDVSRSPLVWSMTKLVTSFYLHTSYRREGHKQWLAEVQFLGVVDHPNLVKLLGYCSVDREKGIQRLLIYEYMPNMSLEDHLFNHSSNTLPWKTRLDIILGAARGLAYLHEGLEVQVIFRDFKTSNVLLDVDLKPKLSDFGLAREGPIGDRSHVSTGVYGTVGYADPGYVDTGHLTTKSDIYSFGVVLYEILTGRRTIERFRPENEKKLLEWVKQFPVDSDMFSMIIDPRLRSHYSISSCRKIARLAESCLNTNAKERPTISEVVKILEDIVLQDLGNGSTSEIANNKQLFAHQVGRDVTRKAIPLPQPRDTSLTV